MSKQCEGIGNERRRRAAVMRRQEGRPRTPRKDLFTPRRGGARKGAGRRPKGSVAGIPHDLREPFGARFPVHVTVKCVRELPKLRRKAEYRVLRQAFAAGAERNGLRLVEYVVMGDHVHMIVEGRDRGSLARGLAGLLVRCARALNRLWERKGKVFADRYHDHVLRSAKEVRTALCYVLQNARRHGERVETIDGYSSGPWFEGWKEEIEIVGAGPRFLARAGTWLLGVGWKRWGWIGVKERPRARA